MWVLQGSERKSKRTGKRQANTNQWMEVFQSISRPFPRGKPKTLLYIRNTPVVHELQDRRLCVGPPGHGEKVETWNETVEIRNTRYIMDWNEIFKSIFSGWRCMRKANQHDKLTYCFIFYITFNTEELMCIILLSLINNIVNTTLHLLHVITRWNSSLCQSRYLFQ